MMEKSTWTLSEKAQARAAFNTAYERGMRHVLDGKIAVLELRPQTRSDEQNRLLHSLLSDISKQVEWAGAKRDIDTWKRLLTAAWLRTKGESIELLPAVDGKGVDIVFRRTSQLTKAECAELCEFIGAWGRVDQDVQFKAFGDKQ